MEILEIDLNAILFSYMQTKQCCMRNEMKTTF